MATLNTLGVDSLSLRGSGEEYNRLSRFFRTRVEAQAALDDGTWVPVAGVLNACVTGDEGVLAYDANNQTLDNADGATRAYIDQQIANVVGDAPEVLDQLSELADAMGDDPAFISNLDTNLTAEIANRTAADTNLQAQIDAEEVARIAADDALDTRIDTTDSALSAEEATRTNADAALNTALGITGGDTDLGTFAGSTIGDSQTVKAALQQLETSLEAVDIDTDDLAALTGIAENISHLGGFSGSTIGDDVTVKDALQALETATETETTNRVAAVAAVQADVDQNESDADAAIAAVQADVDQNESDADAAIAAVQADVDANETASDAAEAALSARLDTLEADPTTATALAAVQADVDQNESDADAAIAAVQADVDQNESDSDAAIATERARIDSILAGADADKDTFAEIVTLINSVDTTNDTAFAGYVTSNNAAVAAVQADVDQNETDSDAADAALGVRIDSVETEIDTARANLYAAIGRNENETHLGVFNGSTVSSNTNVRNAVQELETAVETRLPTLGGQLTGNLTLRKSDGSAVALILSRQDHADMSCVWKVQPSYVSATKEVLTILANGQPVVHFDERQRLAVNMSDPDYTLDVGGDGHFSTNLVVGGTLTLGSTAITATATELNYVDGVTSNVQTQLDAIQADVDQNESDADSAIAAVQADVDQNESDADTAIALKADIAGPTFTGVPAAPTAAAGTNSTQVATTAFVTTAVANVIDSAPGALDTLNELAAALGDDANFSTTITNLVNANETHIDNAVTLTGVAKDAVNLGTFTGSTISDNGTIKASIQELETAVEAAQSEATSAGQIKTQVASNSANYYVTFVDSNNVSATAEALRTGANLKFNPSTKVLDISSGTVHAQYLTLDNTNVNSTAAELNILDGCTATTAELNLLDGVTATTAELNYVDGVTSNIQTQLNAIQADVDGNESDADTAIAANETHIDNMATLTGVAKDATNIGTFTGSTISDNGTMKAGIQELETALELKAPVAGPTFTGTPAAPTASASTNTTQIATTAFVTTAVAALDAAALRTLLGIVSAANDGASGLASGEMYFNTGSNKYVLVA